MCLKNMFTMVYGNFFRVHCKTTKGRKFVRIFCEALKIFFFFVFDFPRKVYEMWKSELRVRIRKFTV